MRIAASILMIIGLISCEEQGIEILNEVVINQVLVRFGDSDTHTHAVIQAVQQEGTCWAGGSIWQGKAVMRISVSNWSTRKSDIERSVDVMVKLHKSLGNVR